MKKKKYSVLGWNKWKMEFSMVSGQKTIAAIALSFNKKESNLFYVLRRRQKEMRKKNQQRKKIKWTYFGEFVQLQNFLKKPIYGL